MEDAPSPQLHEYEMGCVPVDVFTTLHTCGVDVGAIVKYAPALAQLLPTETESEYVQEIPD